jgi:2-C-methyl-D-erythritol 4-phosphate cytidylyltransferase
LPPRPRRTVAIVPAAGRGERLGAGTSKALVPIAGVALIRHAVLSLRACELVGHVVVAAPPDHVSQTRAAAGEQDDRLTVLAGGEERADSVGRALGVAARESPDVVLVHDAARAFTPVAVIRSVAEAVQAGAPAAIPVLPVPDTVKQVDSEGAVVATADRSRLRAVQTPQAFATEVLLRAYRQRSKPATGGVTDDARLVELLGERVRTVPGDPRAMKITTRFDLVIAERILAAREHE